MKKLIAMIGAVAMSFCAFADAGTPTPFALSFEAAEGSTLGVDTSAMTFSPTNVTGWTWAPGDPLQLRAYAGDAYTYGTPAANSRRDGMFLDQDAQYNYLELDTGTAELIRNMGEGNIVADQLVKFTGFEDPQTNLTAGIGVWMSEFVTNDTEDVELTETNLYVTCAQVGSDTKPVALKIAGTFELNKWYRLTIKSIGDIYGGEAMTDSPRQGFLVYIDGEKAICADTAAAAGIVSYADEMTSQAKKFMQDDYRLFPAIDTKSTPVAEVGFKGVGFIDDIIIDAEGPSFVQETLPVTVAPIEGVDFVVKDADGNPVEADGEGKYNIMPGDFTVIYTAQAGYKIVPNPTEVSHDTNVDGTEIDDGETVVPAVVVATVTNGATTNEYAEAELFTAFAALTAGDQVAILKSCSVTNGEEATLYTFTPNTTIDVAADGWDVFVGNYEVDETPTPGMLTAYENISADATMAVTFEDEASGFYIFYGTAVNGQLIVTNGQAMTMPAVTVGNGALIKAATLMPGDSVTLSGSGKVMSVTRLTYTGDEKIFTNDDIEEIAPVAPDTYYTYQIKQAAATWRATVAAAGTGVTLESITTNDIPVGSGAGTYDINVGDSVVVTYALEYGYKLADGSAELIQTLTENDTTESISPTAEAMETVTITVPAQGELPEGVTAVTISQSEDGEDWTVVEDGKIFVGYAWKVEATAAEGKVVENPIKTGTAASGEPISVTPQEIAAKVKDAADAYSLSFEAAESAKGVDVSTMTFNPGEDWTWNSEDPLNLAAYNGDKYQYGTGVYARRDAMFAGTDEQNNYLKLDTGSDELVRSNDYTFVDQLIKFTGYEDIQTNYVAGTKIAVWMGEICTNEETEAMTTNLYVTVGKVSGGGVEQCALKIAGGYALNTWYRLTVKSIGDIYGGNGTSDSARQGFLVYIDGQPAISADEDAKSIVAYQDEMTASAKTYMLAGRLFPAIDATDTTVKAVAYKGIGEIDDLILDNVGPAFTVEEYKFTVEPPAGLYVLKVEDEDGNELRVPYAASPDSWVKIIFAAYPGWKITGDAFVTKQITSDNQEIVVEDDEIDYETIAAIVVDSTGATTNEYVEAELFTAFAALTTGDQVAILKGCSVTNGEEETLYTFTSNTTIDVAANGWDVFVGNYESEGMSTAGMLTAYENISADAMMTVTFEDAAGGYYMFYGTAVNGQLIVTNGQAMTIAEVTVGDGALIKAANLTLGASVTLSGTGKVMTKSNALLDSFLPEGEVEVSEEADEDGYYTYQIKAAPGTFKVTVPDLTAGLAFVAMTNGDTEVTTPAAGSYTVKEGDTFTVVYAPATGYEFTELDEDGVREATKDDPTITPPEVEEILVTAITLDITSTNVVAGESFELIATVTPDTAKNKTIAWTTSDAGVATVADGMVTAVAAGMATITATNAASGKFATCTVTVSAPAPTVYFPQADIEEQYKDRNGTEAKPFVIRKYEDLVALQSMVADGQTTAGVYFEQVADIDFTGKDPWTGIGAKADHPFKGVYDGQNYTISNVTFGMGDYMGFFRRAEGATIKNMTINVAGTPTAYGEGEESGVAAFVGQAYDVTLQNLTATGTIGSEACNCNHSCAGIAVRLNGGTAYACTNKCEIWCSKGKLGGIVAIGQSANMDYFTLCSNEGTLHNTKASITDGGVGGIMGWTGYSQDQNVVITDCRSIGAIVSAETAGTHTASFVGESRGKEQPPVEFAGENIAIDSIRGVGNKPELMPYGEVLGNGLIKVVTSASAFEGGKTYKTMAPDRTPAYTFTDAGTIAFNTNMYAATAFNVTAGDESLEVTETAAEGVVTFTAAIKTFDVTFKPENGSADIVSNDVAYGTAFADVAPKNLEKTGYTFAGWTPVVETIDGTELEFTAQWTAIQYTLTLTGGENVTTNVNPEKATYTYGETVAITATPKTGFTYEGVALGEGWGLNEGGAATNTVTITGNASVAIPNAKKAAITVTVKKGTGIASVSVGGTPLDFDATTSEATFEVSADAPTAQVTLEADDITIPVYKMSIGNPAVDGNVTNKTPVITADANDLSKNYVTFTAEEAKAVDPQVSEAQKKQAIIDSIDTVDQKTHDAAVAKVNAIVTTEATPAVGKVTATELATYITDKKVTSADLAASDYVVASVKLDTDSLITEETEVKIADLKEVTGGAMTFKVEIGEDALDTEKQLNAIKDMVKATKDVADWTTAEKRLEVTATANVDTGTVTITPKTAQDKAFMKVVIQQDPEGVE